MSEVGKESELSAKMVCLRFLPSYSITLADSVALLDLSDFKNDEFVYVY
jgi:hypothetical protein